MAPPAKRQKRLVVLSSEDEEDLKPRDQDLEGKRAKAPESNASSKTPRGNSTAKHSLPTRPRTNSTENGVKSRSSATTHKSLVPSPKKPTRKTKATEKPQVSKPISTFFNNASQTQQVNGHRKPKEIKEEAPEVEDEEEDLIEDESPVEDVVKLRGLQDTTRSVLDRRKRPTLPTQDIAASKQFEKTPLGSQRFKFPGSGLGKGTGTKTPTKARSGETDLRPWVERYGPDNLEELAVQKKKVSDVRNWLKNALQGRDRKRILILKGPSGAGKTTTVTTLAKAMDFELSDWRNPVGSEFSSEGYSSMSAHFEEFLGRSGRFNALSFTNGAGSDYATPSPTAATKGESMEQKVILLEEFPNTFLNSSSALRSFRSSILEYLAVNTPSMTTMLSRPSGANANITPIVIVITETRLTASAAARDSFTAHRLLGSDILSHPGVSTIEFNPMASTLVTKALDLVVQKEARHSGRRRIPGPSVLIQLGEVGDVRSAIGSLEFLCLRAEDGDDWGGRVASRAKKGANASALTKMEKETLELVTQRESSLGLFHAVGKVVYNKRDDAASSSSVAGPLQQPPDHLAEHVRLRVPQTSVDQLIDKTGTDTGTFVAALHENYALSCEGSSFTDTLNGCLEALSDSDLLSSARSGRFGSSGFQGAATDALRQDEICFHVAVHGILFALPNPVKRQTHPVAGKTTGENDTYKMFYPTSMRLSRQTEEIDGLVDRWADRLRAGVAPVGKPVGNPGRPFTGLQSTTQRSVSKDFETSPDHLDEDDNEPFRTSLNCTKTELILERLPFITKIEQRNPASTHINELEKLTQFHGINAPDDDPSDDENLDVAAPATEWVTNRPTDGKRGSSASIAPLQHVLGHAGKEAGMLVLPVEEEVDKLYLSDDDIED